MESANHLHNIIKQYDEEFPNNWINSLLWNSEEDCRNSYVIGLQKINNFTTFVFITLGEFIFKGTFLCESFDEIKDFKDIFLVESEAEVKEVKDLKDNLHRKFAQLNRETYDILMYYYLIITNIHKKYTSSRHNYFINAVSRRSTEHSFPSYDLLVSLMKICASEYELSYNEVYVQNLIIAENKISEREKNESNTDIQGVLKKLHIIINFLLYKLSYVSKDKKIEYYLDFNEVSISNNDEFLETFEPYKKFRYFIEPDKISPQTIVEWQTNCYQHKAPVWQMILLMRFYTIVSKSSMQVNNLINDYKQLCEKLKSTTLSDFDDYALRTITNYMYNSRFSFLVANMPNDYIAITEELKKIEDTQKETFIKNFHPHQKAVVYFIKQIRKDIEEGKDYSEIQQRYPRLLQSMTRLEEAYEWCKDNQYYPFQLTRSECIFESKEFEGEIFAPSSFSCPIKYEELTKEISKLKFDVQALDSEIRIYKEKQDIAHIKDKIDKTKKTYIEILGIFTTIVTFLLSVIMTFVPDKSESVSMSEKIENMLSIGIILFLFANVIIFYSSNIEKKYKNWYVIITSVLYIIILINKLCK